MPRASVLHRFLAACAAAAAFAVACPARADVSAWFFSGGGPSWMSERGSAYELEPTMQLDLGLGTPPSGVAVVGVIGRTTTYFGRGTDLALAARAATGGFVRGQFGLALDAGAFKRWWGTESDGPLASLHLGAPYGLQLSFNALMGRDDHRTYGVLLGIDFLRLTVYRLGGTDWWPNPRPAWRPPADRQ